MLIQGVRSPNVHTLEELSAYAHEVLLDVAKKTPCTAVFGPLVPPRKPSEAGVLGSIWGHAQLLSHKGYVVFDVSSFEHVVERICYNLDQLGQLRGIDRSTVVAQKFTGPLIETGVFAVVNFHQDYRRCPRATLEHTVAVKENVPIEYFG